MLLERGASSVRGYFALSNHFVAFETLPAEQAKGLPNIDIPTVLIGRLAVDQTLHGHGLGKFLLVDALQRVVYLSKLSGLRAVEVHAIDGAAKRFYEKFGFRSLLDEPHHMFLPIDEVTDL